MLATACESFSRTQRALTNLILNGTHALKDLVSKPVLSDAPPDVLNGVELRIIWGKEHQVHISWDPQPPRSVPTRSVKNHQDELVRVSLADLFKKQRHGPPRLPEGARESPLLHPEEKQQQRRR